MKKEVDNARHPAGRRSHADHGLDPQGVVAPSRASGDGLAESLSPLGARSRPRLKPSVDVLVASDGSIYLLHPSAGDLMIKTPPARAASLIQRLDGSRSRSELVAEFAGAEGLEVEVALRQLWDLGLLEDAGDDGAFRVEPADRLRYDRQLAYFAELAPPGCHRESLQARLAAAQVTVLGLGGLGCWTASALACTGVGRIVVVDGDDVELSNLNRQILYTPADVGRGKAETGAGALRAFNPSIEVVAVSRRLESEDDVVDVARGSGAIVELADWPVGKLSRWTAAAAARLGVPHLQASQDPPLVRVGPTFIPGATGCAECQALAQRRDHPLYDELVAYRSGRTEESATFGPACAIVGGVLANEVVNTLLGLAPPATAGRAASIDLRTLEWTWHENVVGDPNCPVCGTRAAARQAGATAYSD